MKNARSGVCCPTCGGTDLRVQLPAVFEWDGFVPSLSEHAVMSTEHPVVDDAHVRCEECDDEWTVGALVPVKPEEKQKI